MDVTGLESCAYSQQHQSGLQIDGDLAPRPHSCAQEDECGRWFRTGLRSFGSCPDSPDGDRTSRSPQRGNQRRGRSSQSPRRGDWRGRWRSHGHRPMRRRPRRQHRVQRRSITERCRHQSDADTEEDGIHEVQVRSPGHDQNTRLLHFYVDVADGHKSTYAACDRSVPIDPNFQARLRENDDHDISSFLVLPELIPARKRKRQQPLLDFTRSKILTSQEYTEGCERLLTQRKANQEEARRKAVDREATKEQRRKEKEEKDLQVRARKEARAAKKLESERLQAERRARRQGGGCGRACGSDEGPSCVHIRRTWFLRQCKCAPRHRRRICSGQRL